MNIKNPTPISITPCPLMNDSMTKMQAPMGKVSAAIVITALLTVMCSPAWPADSAHSPGSYLFNRLLQDLSGQLITSHASKNLPGPVLIVNFVDLSRLNCTSKFGQFLPERLRGLLIKAGWKVVEARTGEKIRLQKHAGPFILSDNTTDLAARVHCSAVLTGTYLYNGGTLTVDTRLISIPGNRVLAAAAAETPCDPYIFSLLRPKGFGCPPSQAGIRIKPFSYRNGSPEGLYGNEINETYFKEDN